MQVKNTTSLIDPFSAFIDLEKVEFKGCKARDQECFCDEGLLQRRSGT